MNMTTTERSPLYSWHASRCDDWCQLGDALLPRQFASADEECSAIEQLALCDLSGLPLFEFKGPGAADWLVSRDLPVPAEIYQGQATPGNGWMTRTGSEEFLLRGAVGSRRSELAGDLPGNGYQQDFLMTSRHDAVLLLAGCRSAELMAQTCALDYAAFTLEKTVFTRVAGVSCGLVKDQVNDDPVCWLWIDPSQALYLWQELVQIIQDLSGSIVGVAAIYPEVD